MNGMTTKQIDSETARLKALIGKLREKLSALKTTGDSLTKESDDYRRKSIRNDDQEAAGRLEGMRTLISFTTTEIGDLTMEIERAEIEICDLQALRVDTLKDDNWAQFIKESKLATAEAKQLDLCLTTLQKLVVPHRDRLNRLSLFCRESGVENRSFDGRHLWRKIQATLHTLAPFEISRQHREYSDKSYTAILEHLLDAADRTRNGSAKAVNE